MNYTITNKEDMGKTYQVLNVDGVLIAERTVMLTSIRNLIDSDALIIYPGKGVAGLRGSEFIKMIDGAYDKDTDTISFSITSNEGIIRYLIHHFQKTFFDFKPIELSETKENVN